MTGDAAEVGLFQCKLTELDVMPVTRRFGTDGGSPLSVMQATSSEAGPEPTSLKALSMKRYVEAACRPRKVRCSVSLFTVSCTNGVPSILWPM